MSVRKDFYEAYRTLRRHSRRLTYFYKATSYYNKLMEKELSTIPTYLLVVVHKVLIQRGYF